MGLQNSINNALSGPITLTLGSDASYDIYYRGASGTLTRLANGVTGQVLLATTGAAPSWGAAGAGDMILASIQSVTGLKTFDKDKLAMKGTSTGVTTFSTANTSGTSYTFTLPAVDITAAQLTKLTTATAATTASTLVERDANGNALVKNIAGAYTTTATAAGTTTLTVSSTFDQFFTGVTTQTCVMPDATTLAVGQVWHIVNNSTGVVTVNKNGGSLIKAMAASSELYLQVTDISSAAGTYTTAYSTDLAIGNATATSITYPSTGKLFDIQMANIQSDFTLTAASGVQPAFDTSQDVFTVEASTTYRVRGKYIMNTGSTTHTTAMAFALGGGASINSLEYTVLLWSAAANTITTTQSALHVSGVASTVLNSTSTAVYTIIEFDGTLRINAGGTVTPQINFSANPTGTNLMKVGSYIEFTKLGSNTVTFVGAFA